MGHRFRCSQCNRSFTRHECRVKEAKTYSSKRGTTRGRSDRQEKHTARKFRGRQTLNSGALDDKGDVKVDNVLRIEDKTTNARSYVLHLDDLLRLSAQTYGDEVPILKVCFEDNLRQQFAIIPAHWLEYLLEQSGHHPKD